MTCPWVIQVMSHMDGREYPAVTLRELLRGQTASVRLPTWRLVEVPPEYQHLGPTEILQACYAARIQWRKQ